jgi:Uma2 family endonuclease
MGTIATRLSVDEFLAMEETKPYRELINGEVIEKAMPPQSHSDAVLDAAFAVRQAVSEAGGHLFTELRCLYLSEDRVFLPDLCVFADDNLPLQGQNPVESVPDFVIEVLSSEDRASRVNEKISFYLRAGVRLLWGRGPGAGSGDDAPAGQPAARRRPGRGPVGGACARRVQCAGGRSVHVSEREGQFVGTDAPLRVGRFAVAAPRSPRGRSLTVAALRAHSSRCIS